MARKRNPRAGRGLHHRRRRLGCGCRQGPDRARRQGRRRWSAAPGATRETFGGDELANINRYNLWPDPLLNPRTVRDHAGRAAARRAVLPGAADGRRRHGPLAGLAAALHARTTSACAPWPATCPARRSPTGRSPMPSSSPTTPRSNGRSASPAKPAPTPSSAPRSRGYPCPPLPMSRYAREIPPGLRRARLELVPDAAGRPVAPVQRAPADRDQRLRPAAWRPDRHALERAQRVRARRGQDRALRPAPGLLCPRAGARWPGPGQGARSTKTPTATWSSSRPTCSSWPAARSRSARLLLLSKSGRFPNGLANGSDLVGRNVTFHEYSAAVGLFDDPIYAWAGGGYVSASSFQFYEHDERRGFVSGGHIAAAGVGIPLPINWRLPGSPTWGAAAKQIDRDYFNHSMAVAMVRARHAAARQPRRARRRGGGRLGPAGGARSR